MRARLASTQASSRSRGQSPRPARPSARNGNSLPPYRVGCSHAEERSRGSSAIVSSGSRRSSSRGRARSLQYRNQRLGARLQLGEIGRRSAADPSGASVAIAHLPSPGPFLPAATLLAASAMTKTASLQDSHRVIARSASDEAISKTIAHSARDCFAVPRNDDEGEHRDLHGRDGYAPRRSRGRVARMVFAHIRVFAERAGSRARSAFNRSRRRRRPIWRCMRSIRAQLLQGPEIPARSAAGRVPPGVARASPELAAQPARRGSPRRPMCRPAHICCASKTQPRRRVAGGDFRGLDQSGRPSTATATSSASRSSPTQRRCSDLAAPTPVCTSTGRSAKKLLEENGQ